MFRLVKKPIHNFLNLVKKSKVLKNFLLFSLLFFLIFLYFWTKPVSKFEGTIKVYDRNEKLLYESSSKLGHQEYANLEDISIELQQAVVLTEDERFYQHAGVDLIAVGRAIKQNIEAQKVVSGASTIPQQLARFTIISPHQIPKTTLIRKIRESLIAIRLSLTNSKQKILEDYLNTMHFGRQTYGVQAASKVYFDKNVSELSLAQSALLTAMIANPSRFDPINFPANAKERRDRILKEMYEKKLIDEERFNRALEEDLPTQISEYEFIAPHAVEMAIAKLEELGIKENQGLSIYTTIDVNWYQLVRKIAKHQIDTVGYQHDLTNASVVVIENQTGNILTLVGGIDYFNEEIFGQNNMAITLRQPGSAMKPVTYATAFEHGIATPATVIEDIEKVYLTKDGEGFIPHNYDGRYRGPVLVRESLASSYNLPAVEMLERVGIENFLDLSHRMGISSMQETDRYDLALTLGGGEVTLLELTNLYATFAREGNYKNTTLVTAIKTNNDKVLYQAPDQQETKVLSEETVYLITDILSDWHARIPTFGQKNPLLLSQPAAVKTGTTTDWHDNWTIGYTKDYTVGVWVGNADNHEMRDISGVTGAAPIWNDVFENLLQFESYTEFVKPENIIEVEICAWDGLLPTANCSDKYKEIFIQGTQPIEYSQLTVKPQYQINDDLVQIVSPRQGTVYEIGAVENEAIVFELAKNTSIIDSTWILDGQTLSNEHCNFNSCSWQPTLGEHQLQAEVQMEDGSLLITERIKFTVKDYKENW